MQIRFFRAPAQAGVPLAAEDGVPDPADVHADTGADDVHVVQVGADACAVVAVVLRAEVGVEILDAGRPARCEGIFKAAADCEAEVQLGLAADAIDAAIDQCGGETTGGIGQEAVEGTVPPSMSAKE